MIYWFTGQPGSGKTTLANETAAAVGCSVLDADLVRSVCPETYDEVGRRRNVTRIQEMAAVLNERDGNVCVACVAPYRNQRDDFKTREDVLEVYCHQSYIERHHVAGYESPTREYITADSDIVAAGQPKAVFMGRYQPWHDGHRWLLSRVPGPKLVQVRRCPRNDHNPLPPRSVVQNIESEYAGQPVWVRLVSDIGSINYGRGVGYEINEWVPTENIAKISATKIRNEQNY